MTKHQPFGARPALAERRLLTPEPQRVLPVTLHPEILRRAITGRVRLIHLTDRRYARMQPGDMLWLREGLTIPVRQPRGDALAVVYGGEAPPPPAKLSMIRGRASATGHLVIHEPLEAGEAISMGIVTTRPPATGFEAGEDHGHSPMLVAAWRALRRWASARVSGVASGWSAACWAGPIIVCAAGRLRREQKTGSAG